MVSSYSICKSSVLESPRLIIGNQIKEATDTRYFNRTMPLQLRPQFEFRIPCPENKSDYFRCDYLNVMTHQQRFTTTTRLTHPGSTTLPAAPPAEATNQLALRATVR